MPTLRHQVWIWRRIEKPGLGHVIVLENSMQHRLSPLRPHFYLEHGPVSQRIIASLAVKRRPSIAHCRADPVETRLICRKLHHISMSENQTSVADGTTSPGKPSPGIWI